MKKIFKLCFLVSCMCCIFPQSALANELGNAILSKKPKLVEELIINGANVNGISATGWSYLSSASLTGEKEIVEILLKHGANVDAKNNDETTPIQVAGNKEVILLLINYGAEVNQVTSQGETLLSLIARSRNKEIVKAIVDSGVDINAKNENGQNALIATIIATMKLKRLLANNKSEFLQINLDNCNENIQLLIDSGIDINLQDDNGVTALSLASQAGDEHLVELLLKHNADVNIIDNNGFSPLKMAILAQNKNIVNMLLENGAQEDENQSNNLGNMGMWEVSHYVDSFGDKTEAKYLTNKELLLGEFSNSATSDSPLGVEILIDRQDKISIMLFEYNSNNPTKASRKFPDKYYIITKDQNGNTTNYSNIINESDRLVLSENDAYWLHSAFLRNKKLDFLIVEVGSGVPSKYLFQIKNTEGYANAYYQLITANN